ncbi:hypothetical protein [Pseudomonas syringae]|uniref:Uncharacterized protein n=1 Tax=Pseudomonas syringae pv. papulans TaxID=83963 RepID=A0A0Q0A971_PSESX|nr:hypothetical protein [Pseudomonas syringae]KPY29474.1 hypothetical protein ALO65_101906 [Pseudomonas syringae pv. papulans]KWS42697.1 hypothetical protein AL059_18500 [Pseudomonas syringae pv. papulans]MDH4601359.1 hypothetical protein [Pseudomonas syringae pv. papulans]MDH4622926.1 hypothetical protein [Pseudomonas syringae pv. papulans]RMN39120.1 hypothetical protein ALQ60_101781 [Pseudomonas syringae pv. papulans]
MPAKARQLDNRRALQETWQHGLLVSAFRLGTMTSSIPAYQYAATGGVRQDQIDLITARAVDAVIHFIDIANGAR